MLHVTNGESAGNTLRRTAIGGAFVTWSDTLHEGPVPAGPRAGLLRIRAGFLSECGFGNRRALLSGLERRDEQFLAALREGRRTVLWFEHDLYDQLQLIDALALADEVGASPELIVVGSFAGRQQFTGLGELDANELETLWATRSEASPGALAAATSIWAAFRAPDPLGLAEWATRELPALPFVPGALRRLLEELPSRANGLSATEQHALEAIEAGAETQAAAFVASQRLEPAPFLGDTWFYRLLAALGGAKVRLVETEGPQRRLRLTTEGTSVLRGETDRVALLGIDRWIGGTHVTPQNDWRWDADAQRVVAPAR